MGPHVALLWLPCPPWLRAARKRIGCAWARALLPLMVAARAAAQGRSPHQARHMVVAIIMYAVYVEC